MSGSGEVTVSRIWNTSDIDYVFPGDFSFFGPYLEYHVKEILEVEGEAYVSRSSDGKISGIFIYDVSEKTGTIFTRSRTVFDYFYQLKPFNFLFSELKTELESEVYDIYSIELEKFPVDHRFSHEISILNEKNEEELERFMVASHTGMNRQWVNVALRNGDKCFIVRLGSEIAGVGWLSLVNRVGRLHTLYVKPEVRKLGIGTDILYARLLWLKSKRARSAFSEISRYNISSSRVAIKGNMAVATQIFLHYKKSVSVKPENLVSVARF